VRAADTSVVVAALAGWHEGHDVASAAVASDVRLPAHCLLEAFSVLTRLPPPHRFEPRAACDLLRSTFPHEPLAIDGKAHSTLLAGLVEVGISGGSTYDALIGITAREHGAVLLTRDRRAVRVYSALGVRFETVG
jgi:predicted nucleic acid-binding protein